ncbi:hypothetical protein [Falsirhodobacter sp. 1013]|uniref:hypothetical protein n=1 Tax=Falsirhodobacter sp. 1013 TaxID=3417566 RepID=UPI003EB98BD3
MGRGFDLIDKGHGEVVEGDIAAFGPDQQIVLAQPEGAGPLSGKDLGRWGQEGSIQILHGWQQRQESLPLRASSL